MLSANSLCAEILTWKVDLLTMYFFTYFTQKKDHKYFSVKSRVFFMDVRENKGFSSSFSMYIV